MSPGVTVAITAHTARELSAPQVRPAQDESGVRSLETNYSTQPLFKSEFLWKVSADKKALADNLRD